MDLSILTSVRLPLMLFCDQSHFASRHPHLSVVQFVKDQFHRAKPEVRQQQRGEIMKQTSHPVKRFSKINLKLFYLLSWLRGQDLNLRPSGYEPDELPTAPPRVRQRGALSRHSPGTSRTIWRYKDYFFSTHSISDDHCPISRRCFARGGSNTVAPAAATLT